LRRSGIAEVGILPSDGNASGGPLSSASTPAYNIAPTQKVLCIRDGEEREFFKAKWGLIPSWAKDAKIGASCINARVETVDIKPAFRSAFKKRRCLVMADGFYEWRNTDKQPHFISLKSGEQMAFAGLWEFWKSPEGPVESCTDGRARHDGSVT
jgi:putative SOS response-associated peptidase YedK